MPKVTHEFIGYISEKDDPPYIAKNILRWAKHWVSEKKYPECHLTKQVRVKITLEETNE